MKFVMLMSTVVVLVVAQDSFYVTEDDYVDIEAIIADLPTFQAFSNCFLDRGPCTSQTQSYKDIFQDIVINACHRCNLPQKQRIARFFRGLKSRLPEDYQSLREKYDPTNMYMDALEAELSKFVDQPLVQRPTA